MAYRLESYTQHSKVHKDKSNKTHSRVSLIASVVWIWAQCKKVFADLLQDIVFMEVSISKGDNNENTDL